MLLYKYRNLLLFGGTLMDKETFLNLTFDFARINKTYFTNYSFILQ